MKLRFSILILLLSLAGGVFAQGVRFTASVNKNPVGTGDIFEVTFAVNGNGDGFNPPQFTGFELAGGPNQSTSMEIVNGSSTQSTAFSYDLMAVKEGEFTIGSATIIVNGHTLKTNPIKIKVVKGSSVPQNSQAQSGGVGGAGQVTARNTSDLSKLIFIREVPDKTTVYQGEQLTLNYRLYTKVDISQYQVTNLPDLNGFWNEDIKSVSGQPAKAHIEVYKGQKYEVADLKRTILFPEHSGNITIDPFELTVIAKVPVASNDIMDQFFGSYKEQKYVAKSPSTAVHVKPLPDAGKPDSFTGAVGSFNVETSVDKTELKANDAFNYKVKVSGKGNIKLLKTLSTAFPADFDKYDPKINDSVTEDENGVSGDRYYNYLLIPRHQGDYTIDPLKFSWFNPATGRYSTLITKGFHIKVDKGTSQSNVTAFSDADKQDIKMLDKDIRYIKTDDSGLSKQGDLFFGSFGYYLLLLIGPCLCYGAYRYRNFLIKNNSDLVKVKSRQAGKVAAKHLANAQKQLQAGNSKSFYEDLFKGLYGYLSDKLNIQYADLNKETIATALKERKVSDPLLKRLQDTLDQCEMARYAPVNIPENEVFEKAKGIINDIENEI